MANQPSAAELAKLEEELDPEMQFRKVPHGTALLIGGLLLALSAFHYYTAGFGLMRETTHRGIHLAFVLGLIFLVFAARKSEAGTVYPSTVFRPGGVPLYDWICAAAVAMTSPCGSAIPMSSLASTMMRRAMKRGSSPASIIRAR